MRDDDDAADPNADGAWSAWDDAPGDEAERHPYADRAEQISDPLAPDADDPAARDDAPDDTFGALLRSLRAVPGPCAPPIGEGAFDILYASAREIVVWFVSAKDGVEQREVAIPARLARLAWEVIRRGEPVDEATLRTVAAGAYGGRWLLALFAQLPSVETRSDPESDAVTLLWRGEAVEPPA